MFKQLIFQILYDKYTPNEIEKMCVKCQNLFQHHLSHHEPPETFPQRSLLNAALDVMYHTGIDERVGTETCPEHMS